MHATKIPIRRWQLVPLSLVVVAVSCLAMLSAGCNKGSDRTGTGGRTKLTIAYLGLTCEAPIFVAYEKEFYGEEGLEAELVRTDWDGLREGLGLGKFDANHTLVMYLLKPIEQGLDVKMTGGIHTGCLRVQVGVNSTLRMADLKGKKIGVPTHLGSPPYLFASRVLAVNGIDPSPEKKDVEWLAFPPAELGLAIEDGRIDAMATSDPIGTILLGQGIVKTIADQAVDDPYRDEYCCAAVVSGKLARENPAVAAKVTRALLKGAKWVNDNPAAAAQLSVEKKYVASTVEINSQALAKLKYLPAVAKCRLSIDRAAAEMQTAGLLRAGTDPAELAKRAWIDLDGVTDEWIQTIKFDNVANGGRPELLDAVGFAALFEGGKRCIDDCCIISR